MEKSLWDKAGDVGGLDGLMRSGPQLGCPEKKKRKSSGQGSSLPSLSEYAPPTNTSSDHLIACNPFDDDYSIPPFSGYTYFGKLGYSNIESFNTFRMPPNTSPKRLSRGFGNQMLRDQPPPFAKDLKMIGKSFPFIVGMQEKSHFENESFYYSALGQTITMPGQHFRAYQNEEDLHLMTSLNSAPRIDFQLASYRPQGVKMNASQIDSSSSFTSAQAHFLPSRISSSNQDLVLLPINHSSSAGLQDKLNLDAPTHPTSSPKHNSKHMGDLENSQADAIDLSDCGQPKGIRNRPALSRLAKTDVTPSEKCNRWLLHSDFCGNFSADNLNPCGICSAEVNNVADAIMCEASCQKWFHRTCTGMTEVAYALLRAETSAIWICDTCVAKKDIQLRHYRKNGIR
ncbi:PREDICTED: pygopus homolog 1 [Nanorana parkeri]|uniref:pygopus homolog 1 n=1 Tax=Nanorana parkeri TaxID=125878 RepID=UPI000854F30B|nr:PREDICTED: pygopus homolog 1 [Nanorana parkeri]